MPRIRTIKPEAFQSESLSQVPVSTERTFFGLLTQADDEGRIKHGAKVLNGVLWALRPEHTVADMESDLSALVDADLLCRYEVDGRTYLHLPTWREHQRINRPTASKIPPCPDHETARQQPPANQSHGQAMIEGTEPPGQPQPQHGKNRTAYEVGPESAAAINEGAIEPTIEVPSDLSGLCVAAPAFTEPSYEERSRQTTVLDPIQVVAALDAGPDAVRATCESDLPMDGGASDADTTSITSGSEGDEPMTAVPHPDQGAFDFDVPKVEQPPKAPKVPKTPQEERRQRVQEIVQAWWEKYGKGQSQPYPAIFRVVETALKNGMPVSDVNYALDVIGREKKPVSGGTIQFALSNRPKKDADAIIAEQSARRDIRNFSTKW